MRRLVRISILLATCLGAEPAPAQLSVAPGGNLAPRTRTGLRAAGTLTDNIFVPSTGSSLSLQPGEVSPQNLGAFTIVIVPDAGLAANTPALLAFNRAAQSWAARISDPITVTINAGLGPLPPNVIGSTSSAILEGSYTEIRDQLVVDASAEADDGIVAKLPTAAQFNAAVPTGGSLPGEVLISKANAKAAGFTGIDQLFGTSDGAITFSNSFAFDFDHSDGVGPGLLDFETVAAHEIGHLLGFSSIVDSVDFGMMEIAPFTLDLFRFADDTAIDPETEAQFTTFPRALEAGVPSITDQITGSTPEWEMSTGVNTGDGRQASHWKADELTGEFIGLMDPTLAFGHYYDPQESDFRALDLIGYDVAPVPEPSIIGLLAPLIGAGLGLPRLRRRQLAQSSSIRCARKRTRAASPPGTSAMPYPA